MSAPEFDHDNPDATSMFDFLAEEGTEEHRRKKRVTAAAERPLPIIRKPVPVSESGPLLPPKPGAPVEPPPALTGGSAIVEDDLGFLDDITDSTPHGTVGRSASGRADSDSNITRLDPRSRRAGGGIDRTATTQFRQDFTTPAFRDDDFDDFGLDLDDDLGFTRNRAAPVFDEDGKPTPGRGRWLALALFLLAAGTGLFLFAKPLDWRVMIKDLWVDTPAHPEAGDATAMDSGDVGLAVEDVTTSTPSLLMQRFSEQLQLVEGLIADGALDDADQALSSMDRTVYGYGAAEFSALQSRLEQLRSGVAVTDGEAEARAATEQAAREEQARVAAQATRAEEARDAAKQAAQEEQARVAAQAARAEEARNAAKQAAQEEQARVAAQAARAEEARNAAQQAAQEESARRAAAEQTAREEQARRQEQARLASQTARTSDWQSVDTDRQATDRRIAEERAALQRQKAREKRLIEATEREAALAAQALSNKPETVPSAAVPQSNTANAGQPRAVQTESPAVVVDKRAPGYQSIGDDELQTVYRRFIDLQKAVSNRDINAVVGLTTRSGVRVQQLMQMFENSTQIDARIRNVSTSNTTGQIKGTLQINRIKRTDGTFVEPPADLSSIPLSSQREGDGWSSISW